MLLKNSFQPHIHICFIAVPWIFLPTSKSFPSKYLQRKLFDSMIFHTTVDQLKMDEKNTVKKLSSFLTPNWSFELCQLPRLKKIEIVVANNVMWYTIQCRQPLFLARSIQSRELQQFSIYKMHSNFDLEF